jgi:hypothetical protein
MANKRLTGHVDIKTMLYTQALVFAEDYGVWCVGNQSLSPAKQVHQGAKLLRIQDFAISKVSC